MKGFKRILALSLAVVTLATFSACQMFKSEEEETTKLSAEDLLTATNSGTEQQTDFEGNTLPDNAKEEIDKFNGSEEVLDKDYTVTTKADSTTKKQNTTTSNNNKSTTKNNGGNGNSGETVTLPAASHFNTLNQEFFGKGIFTIEGVMSADVNGETMSLPFKLARNGKEQYIRAQYTYQKITVGMIVNNTKTYLLLPDLKIYQEIGESILGDSDYSGLTDVKTYVSTKRVKIGDNIYVCEEVKGSDGFSTYFYFLEDTGELSRIKFEDEGGVSLLKVSSIKPTVDKSEFAIPKGYKKADIEDLG